MAQLTTSALQDALNDNLVEAISNGHKAPSQRRLHQIQAQCLELHQRVFEGTATTIHRRSRIWDKPDSAAHFGREDYDKLPERTPRRLPFGGTYAGRKLTIFYST